MSGRRVIVSRHALERARLRYRDELLRPSDLRSEIEASIAAGREGLRLPAGMRVDLTRTARLHDQRFVWSEDQRRCYLVKRARSRDGSGPILIVITSLANAAKEAAVQGAKP